MKARLYTMLKVKSDYGLSLTEKVLAWIVEDVTDSEYIRNLIELRDSGNIHEDNDGNAVMYRNRYLTEKGRIYLQKVKELYLRELWVKNRWKILGSIFASVCTLLGALLGKLMNL